MPSAKFESFLTHQAQSRIVAEPELYHIAIISLSYPYLILIKSLSYSYRIPIISLSNPHHIPILNQPSSLQLSNLMIYHIILLIFFTQNIIMNQKHKKQTQTTNIEEEDGDVNLVLPGWKHQSGPVGFGCIPRRGSRATRPWSWRRSWPGWTRRPLEENEDYYRSVSQRIASVSRSVPLEIFNIN